MPNTSLSEWQARFFVDRVQTPASGEKGVYYREQVFGAIEVLSEALPEVVEELGENNFRYFVRELLRETQPTDALGTSLVPRFQAFLKTRPELQDSPI